MNKFNEEFNSTCTDCPNDEITEDVGADNQSLCMQQPSSSQVEPTTAAESETESSTIETEPETTDVEPTKSETEPATSATESSTSESEPETTDTEHVTSVLLSGSETEKTTGNQATTALMEEITESTGSKIYILQTLHLATSFQI